MFQEIVKINVQLAFSTCWDNSASGAFVGVLWGWSSEVEAWFKASIVLLPVLFAFNL
jgi:hypothetical protein